MLQKVRMTEYSKKLAIACLLRYRDGPTFNEGAQGINRFTPALDNFFLCGLSRLLGQGDRKRRAAGGSADGDCLFPLPRSSRDDAPATGVSNPLL